MRPPGPEAGQDGPPPPPDEGERSPRFFRAFGDGPGPRYTYSGVALMKPALVAPVKPGDKAPLAPLLYEAARRGQLGGELYQGLWQDVGTVERLAELEKYLREHL